jgi:hypothetical protein
MAIERQQLDKWFSSGVLPAKAEGIPEAQDIRVQSLRLAETIIKNSPANSDQSVAVRKVREKMMAAIQSIILK